MTTPIWILPIRERPLQLPKILSRAGHASILVILDLDDPHAEWHASTCESFHIPYLIAPADSTTVQKINLGIQHRPFASAYGFLGDDLTLPDDPTWADQLAARVPDFGLAFCSDSIQERRLPTHPLVDAKLVHALGWWAYPNCKHSGIDVILRDIAYAFGGCEYVEEVTFIHHHPSANTAPDDPIYQRAQEWREHDRIAYDHYLRHDLAPSFARVQEARNLFALKGVTP